jgi:hypothetical protein
VARTIESDVARATRGAEPERPQERFTAEFLRLTPEFEALGNELLERCPADLAELAENERQRREREERRDAVQVLLRQVEDALERLERGSYGRCERCGEPIRADASRCCLSRCGALVTRRPDRRISRGMGAPPCYGRTGRRRRGRPRSCARVRTGRPSRQSGGAVAEALTEALASFAREMTTLYDPDELLQQLVDRATTILAAAGAGIMLADDAGELRYVAATDDRVVAAEQHQDRVRDGVCFEAYTSGRPLAVADLLAAADRWPAYADGVLHLGFRAVLGIPMRGAGSKIGVLNVYRSEPGTWSRDDVDAAEVLGIMGTGYILHGYQQRDHHSVVEQLQAAIASRDLIGQAKGILMAELDVDAETAFQVLRERSQRSNQKLRDVAGQLVDGHRAQRTPGALPE